MLLAAGFACLCLITKNLSQYFLLDNAIAALGILVTVLKMLSYIEFTYFGICNEIFAVLLYILMLKNNPEQSTYLIFSLYSLVCAVVALAFDNPETAECSVVNTQNHRPEKTSGRWF